MNKKWDQEKFSTVVAISDYIIGCRKGKISYMFEYSKKGWIYRERTDLREENVKSAFYALAKKNVEDFRTLYHLLKMNDVEYFIIASEVLTEIQKEYEFLD